MFAPVHASPVNPVLPSLDFVVFDALEGEFLHSQRGGASRDMLSTDSGESMKYFLAPRAGNERLNSRRFRRSPSTLRAGQQGFDCQPFDYSASTRKIAFSGDGLRAT